MSLLVLESSVWLPVSIDRIWDFMTVVKNFEDITPKPMALHLKNNMLIEPGAKMKADLEWAGLIVNLPIELSFTKIQATGPHREFTDEMSQGPLNHWVHRHCFDQGSIIVEGQRTQVPVKVREPGCWLSDRIEVGALKLPFSKKLSHKVLERQLRYLLTYRYQKLRETLCGLAS